MILNNIFLYPDLVEFNDRNEDLSIVRNQTRHICNYLARNLQKLKFPVSGFNKICVIGMTNPKGTYLNSSSALSVGVIFDMNECRKIERKDLGDYYSNLLKTGLNNCAKNYKLPIEEMFLWLEELKKNNYKNEWIFKERTFKKYNIKCKLQCAIDLDRFTLSLVVFQKDEEVFNEIILETIPDEIVYHHRFKDIEMIGFVITVTTRFEDKPLFQLHLRSLLK
ncbi:hypothetical protein [Flavobacterium ginsengiterrae]|uniref:Uncharacterized protein n=1 Tax=Flavobacterium ginsengiterrae TaxID=871695 RepID=A0ABP7GHH9_9FLAO